MRVFSLRAMRLTCAAWSIARATMRRIAAPGRQQRMLMQVFVRDNNVEQALRALKKKMQREGVFREMKRRRFYEKPSEESARRKSEAIRRARKLARKQAIREGLIAAPKKKLDANGKPVVPGRGRGRPAAAANPTQI
jgi:small subunit ribosomal protein S21